MEVKSKAEYIALLDEAIALADQLHVLLDEAETYMKGSICCNTQVSQEVPKAP